MQWLAYLSMTVLMLVGILLIFIVLLQRGRGGGLAGALGGMGGQSAFGTKAGDVFTKITVGLAIIWVVLAAGSTFALRTGATRFTGGAGSTANEPAIPTSPEGGLPPRPMPLDEPVGQLESGPPVGTSGGDTSTETSTTTPAEKEETPAEKPESPAAPAPAETESPAAAPEKE